ncbi:MAG: hypothetical protein WKF55_09875 [Gemmatimonadaceae bacterium]
MQLAEALSAGQDLNSQLNLPGDVASPAIHAQMFSGDSRRCLARQCRCKMMLIRNVGVYFFVVGTVVFLGCHERVMSNETGLSRFSTPADGAARLDPQVRADLADRFDVDAVERLLQRLASSERGHLLQTLGVASASSASEEPQVGSATAAASAAGRSDRQDVRIEIKSEDPAKQALLDEIWAPYWLLLPSSALDDLSYPYPGRELARSRLKAIEQAPKE